MSDTTVPEGYKRNAQGALVPLANIKPEHLLEDELVTELLDAAGSMSAVLSAFKTTSFEKVDAYLDLVAQQYGAKMGGKRGGVSLASFDGSRRVQIAIGDHVELGPELQIAKTLIDECLIRWAEGANSHLRTIVMDAFRVDQKGRLDTQRILALRRHAIDDETWKRAMEAIGNSVRVARTSRYIRFYLRQENGAEVQVAMDLASVPAVQVAS